MPGLDLLERDGEMHRVDDLLADAAASEGRFVLIEGPAGIGKSRVLAELRRRAGTRVRVLSARGGELEGAFPFGVVRQLFEGVLADRELAERVFAGAAAPARDVLGAPTGSTQSGGASFAVLHGLYWLALNLAEEQPLVLAVDDLHWVDRPSLRYLAYLVRRLDGAPILVAATLRSSEPGVDPVLLAELAQDPIAIPLRPRPLSDDAVAALVADRLGEAGEPEFVRACHRATGGNPLLLRQLLIALGADGVRPRASETEMVRQIAPRAVSRTVLLRLARLSGEAAAVARAAAVLGDQATPAHIAGLAGLEPQEVADATGALIRAEILRPEPPVAFVHPLVRDAVYQEVPPAERELLHAAAADTLRAAGAPAAQVANQLLLVPPRGEAWVVDAAIEAGHDAIARGAPDGAVAHLRRALEEPPAPDRRVGVLRELALTEAQTSGPGAAEHLRVVLAETDDPLARADIAHVLARTLIFTGDPAEAAAVARDTSARLDDADPVQRDARLGFLAVDAVTRIFGVGDPSGLDALRPFRRRPGPGAGTGELLATAMAIYLWAHRGGPAEQICDTALWLLRDGGLRLADDPLITVGAFYVLQCAERDESVDLWEQSRAEAHRAGSLLASSTIHTWYGHTLWRRGDLAQARAELESGIGELRQWGYSETIMATSGGYLAPILIEQGDLDTAGRHLAEIPKPEDDSLPAFNWLYGRALLSLAQGRAQDALEACDELERRASWVSHPIDYAWHVPRALALDRLDRRDEALEVAEDWLERARAWGAPGTVGSALQVLGTVQRDAGLDTLQEAVEVLDTSAARLESAKALAALGGALRRARRPSDAREPLRRALDVASACDAHGLVEHVRAELHAAGARPRSDALAGVEALTPSERRVVDLAAVGQANREIAQTLFVTPKTVEVHLTNAYRKLGVRSRRELAGALS
ncbi:MAG: AAA family ATPase [Solirubrobacteraceae bacterium]|nr:AAA family ATPase [Solirubrobacteraceae bacterium]